MFCISLLDSDQSFYILDNDMDIFILLKFIWNSYYIFRWFMLLRPGTTKACVFSVIKIWNTAQTGIKAITLTTNKSKP